MKIRADELVRKCKKNLNVNDISEILWINICNTKYNDMIEVNKEQSKRLFWLSINK